MCMCESKKREKQTDRRTNERASACFHLSPLLLTSSVWLAQGVDKEREQKRRNERASEGSSVREGYCPVHASQLEREASDNKGLMKYHKVSKICRKTEKREEGVCPIKAV